jgi:hypothetical protein
MSCWYTRKELALRISILYSGLLIAQAFSGIIAAGIFNGLEGTGGMLAWQWYVSVELFIVRNSNTDAFHFSGCSS